MKMWTHGVPVDEQLKQQPLNTVSMPFIYKWLVVMASSQVRILAGSPSDNAHIGKPAKPPS
ncbi:MAG TPA: hypothetical protein VKB81_04040 [Nitrospira sp.]|nr:hypothetical protein [Nitrospira sp.]